MQTDGSKKEITIKDLAMMLDLSSATVCRGLNDDDSVSQKTKRRILDLVEKVGYRGNDYARILRSGRSNTIGCIVPRIDNYLASTILSGMEKAAHFEGYNLMVMQSLSSVETAAECIDLLLNKRVDGLVMVFPEEADFRPLTSFVHKKIPIISLGRSGNALAHVNISINNYKAGYEMTRHLLMQGRRRILHITADLSIPAYRERCEGYKQALADAVLPDHIIKGNGSREGGMAAVSELLVWAQRPDAVFAANDHCAAGCLVALRRKGINVPKEIAVAGFDNDPVCLVTEPGLTTIDYPGSQMGEAAVRQLIYQLEGTTQGKAVDIELRSPLIIRGST